MSQTQRHLPMLVLLILLLATFACSTGDLLPDPEGLATDVLPTTDGPPAIATNPLLNISPVPAATRTPTPTPDPAITPLPEGWGAPGIGDPYFPAMGNGGYDVQHYTLDIDVDMENQSLAASATIEAIASQPLDRFNLDFAGMAIDGITVNGSAAGHERDGGELVILPADRLPAGEAFTVMVDYHGTPGLAVQPGTADYAEGWDFYEGGVAVAGEPTGASGWFPVNMHPADKATYTYRITVGRDYVVAANGIETSVTDNGDTLTYVFEMTDPMAAYLTTVAIGDFDVRQDTTASGIPVRNYFGAGIDERIIEEFDSQPEMLDYFESVFGPYPFDVYGAVVHPIGLHFALETQTLAVFGNTFVNSGVISHELAHMWYGDSVSPATWQDIWLNEGFATYASILWAENQYGPEAADNEIASYYLAIMQSAGGRTIPIADPGADRMFDRAVYIRGAITLHALRYEIGEDAFFRLLREFYDRYRDANASTADFIALSEEISGQDLADFFDGWLYQNDLPDFPALELTNSNEEG